MLADYHIHSTVSGDGKSTMREQIAACLAKGVNKICFTEHMDIGIQNGKFESDLKQYAEVFADAKAAFPQAELYMGMELGYTADTHAELERRAAALPLDYRLLSCHIVNGIDPYEPIFFEGKTREQAAREYLEAVLEGVENFEDYDAVAHIGYVFKFTGDRFPPLVYADAPELLDRILGHMARHGKALEINTSRWNGSGMPGWDIVERFRQLGGQWITLGSDAHHTDGTAKGFSACVEQLKARGITQIATFQKRKLVPERI